MIAHLRGTLLEKRPGLVLVEVHGVGYQVFIPLSTYYELGAEGADVSFRIHTHVREDTLALYGFLSRLEEALFQRLISVASVGPSLALKVLSGLEPRELVDAIRSEDLRRLGTIPGVGKKTAERVVLELKEKMPAMVAVTGVAETEGPSAAVQGSLGDDLLSALLNLGYQRKPAEKAVSGALRNGPEDSFASALKKALRHLSS